jgi:hypothetical protein
MLKPSECFSGTLADITRLSLVLPREKYERHFLIVPFADKMHVIFLGIAERFESFERTRDTPWSGLIVPNVEIELDETSASVFDAQSQYAPPGALVRVKDRLQIAAKFADRHHAMPGTQIPILAGLPPCSENSAVGFKRWKIVLGEGEAKRMLFTVDLTAAPS